MLHAIGWAVACGCAGFAARCLTTRLLQWIFGRLSREGGRTWRLAVGHWVLTVGLVREEHDNPVP